MSEKWLYAGSLAAICVIGSAMFAASQNFVPDVTFKGSVLTGWHKLGDADWRADQGEIIGAPKHESGGWSGAEDLAPGFSKLAPSVPEATAPAPPKPAAAGGNGGGRGRGGRGGPALHADDWTAVQIILDADVLATAVNQAAAPAGPPAIT